MDDAAGKAASQHGLFASAKGLLGTGIALLHNRLELLGVELAEERVRLVDGTQLAYSHEITGPDGSTERHEIEDHRINASRVQLAQGNAPDTN